MLPSIPTEGSEWPGLSRVSSLSATAQGPESGESLVGSYCWSWTGRLTQKVPSEGAWCSGAGGPGQVRLL